MNREQRRELQKRPMFQAYATDKEGKHLPVSPATDNRQMPEMVCEAINKLVATGKPYVFHDARVVAISHIEH